MIDQELEHFDVRTISPRELARQAEFTKNMLFAATAVSLAILGASAFFLSLWL